MSYNRSSQFFKTCCIGVLCVLTSSVVLADDAATACRAFLKNILSAPVRENIFHRSFACTDLVPHGASVMQTCTAYAQPNSPICGVVFYSSQPADNVLQCSAAPAFGQPQVLYKYVLCKGITGNYYWALLFNPQALNVPTVFPQYKP